MFKSEKYYRSIFNTELEAAIRRNELDMHVSTLTSNADLNAFLCNRIRQLYESEQTFSEMIQSANKYAGTYPGWKAIQEHREILKDMHQGDAFPLPHYMHWLSLDNYLCKNMVALHNLFINGIGSPSNDAFNFHVRCQHKALNISEKDHLDKLDLRWKEAMGEDHLKAVREQYPSFQSAEEFHKSKVSTDYRSLARDLVKNTMYVFSN